MGVVEQAADSCAAAGSGEKLSVQCRIGIAEPVSLSKLMDTYLEYAEIVGQILARWIEREPLTTYLAFTRV